MLLKLDCPVCCRESGVFRLRYTAQEAALTAPWLSRRVVTLSLQVFNAVAGQGPEKLHLMFKLANKVSYSCHRSSLPELAENIQPVLIVIKFRLDLVIKHYGPPGISITGQCSPSEVWYII